MARTAAERKSKMTEVFLPQFTDQTYEQVEAKLLDDGYVLRTTSESGSRYYDKPNSRPIRVSDHEPNQATFHWLYQARGADLRVVRTTSTECADITPSGDYDVPPELTYHQRPEVSRGMLATLAESPRLYERTYVTRECEPQSNDNLTIGTGTHAICLKDAIELDKFLLIPKSVLTSNGQRRGKKWDQFVADNPGKTLLLESQFEFCKLLSARLTEAVGAFINNPRSLLEHEVYWNHRGCDCRAKLDIVCPTPTGRIVIDLKTASDISQWGFRKEVRNRRLWLQDAHYSVGAEAEFGEPVRFLFAVAEKSEPFRVRIRELHEDDKARAKRRHNELTEEVMRRKESGDYSEAGEGEIETIEEIGELA